MKELISGAMVMGYLVASLFFLRFWRAGRDRFFAAFALSFFLLALQRTALALTEQASRYELALYGLRAAAFFLILLAIIDKNRAVE